MTDQAPTPGRTRIRGALTAFVLTAALFGVSGPALSDSEPTRAADGTASAGFPAAHVAATATDSLPTPILIQGVDLHDVTIKKFDDTYYMYGSMYGCGYQWYVSGTPWCGLGVSTAPSLQGPWTAPAALFNPNSLDPWSKRSWQETCGGTGQGCFNPRMIQRTGWGSNDGVFVLWFNAPRHYSDSNANAYNVMGCAGPAGPCGPGVTPNGSYNKPVLSVCAGNGDYGIIERPSTRPAIVCSMPGATQLNLEELNYSGSGGTGQGVRKVAGMDGTVEGPGGWWDETTQRYILTFSDQGCGYCAGTPAGYATSTTLYSGWSAPGNVGWGAPDFARRMFSGASCGGQPRTVTVIDGQPWQIIDLWLGIRNETAADTLLAPLSYTPTTGTPGDGTVWVPPVSMPCT
ncbi:hypothetical protein P1P75_11920 [Streptomyces sp. ID05-39B]|uniref:hypothetical protein n=1 Tax=Streptomyces sp. ID05-39B TaxID=3028664 RepID=UPI0029B1432A|nr:hypothetical protein [Streptomyces sp. ID05-39B]MDX3527130.1 hypothetical protein [Streptomyces sp. ID05-39B]